MGENKNTYETTVSMGSPFQATPGALQVEASAWGKLNFAVDFSWYQPAEVFGWPSDT